VLEQSAVALAIGTGGAILLLLTGTEILNWYWVLLLALASLGTGLYRLRATIPSTYTLAQRIDRRLSLADALSTATYFATPDAHGDPAIRERQRQEADSIARTIDPQAAVPFKRPKYIYHAMALAAVALGLFALRYAVTGRLDLQPNLVKIALDTFFPTKTEMAKAKKPRDPLKPPPLDQGDPDSQTVQNDQAPDTPIENTDVPDVNNPQNADNSKDAAQKGRQQEDQSNDTQAENQDKGDKQSGNDANQDDAKNSKDGKQDGKQDSKQGSSNENSSLMDKLKDAMANMMNKMKPSNKDGQQSQNAQNQQKGQQDKSNQQGKQGQSQNQQSNADAQSDQQQSDSDQKQSADAKGSEKSSDKNASQDSKSGIGSADFDYDEDTETYSYTLDSRWRTLFGNREYSLIDWQKRLWIGRNQDMAKTLQRLIATSSNPVQRYELDWLKAKMKYASPMRKFKESLESAINELTRLEIIARGRIEESGKGKAQLLLIMTAELRRHSVPSTSA